MSVALFSGRLQLGDRIPQFCKHGFIYIACIESAEISLCDEQVYGTLMFDYRANRIAEPVQLIQMVLTVRDKPARTI